MGNKKDYLEKIDEVIKGGKFKDTWESLSQYEIPEWYKNAKFGIFVHWGVYSVPAFMSEWYSRQMYIQGSDEFKHHIKTYGTHDKFGYKDFIPMFKAEKFDAKEWIDLFKQTGAKYVMPVGEHHDGFQMYDGEFTEYTSVKMGPNRDVLGEIKQECDKQGLVFCASSHKAENWWFFGEGKKFNSDVQDHKNAGIYGYGAERSKNDLIDPCPNKEFLEEWLVKTCEIVDKYQPKIVFFDWWIKNLAFKPYLRKFAAYYYNRAIEWGATVAINYKHDAYMTGTAVLDIERGQLKDIRPQLWQNDTAVAKNSWCYTEGNEYKTPNDIICDLVDVVSKNGCLLLDVGPKSDGTIPDEDKNILLEIGKWISVNGEAIYDTKHWKVYGEGPTEVKEGQMTDTLRSSFTSEDIRFTFKNGVLYAFVLKMPEDGIVRIKALKNKSKHFASVITDISMLGFDEKPQWIVWDESLTIKTSTIKSEYPVCFKIVMD